MKICVYLRNLRIELRFLGLSACGLLPGGIFRRMQLLFFSLFSTRIAHSKESENEKVIPRRANALLQPPQRCGFLASILRANHFDRTDRQRGHLDSH